MTRFLFLTLLHESRLVAVQLSERVWLVQTNPGHIGPNQLQTKYVCTRVRCNTTVGAIVGRHRYFLAHLMTLCIINKERLVKWWLCVCVCERVAWWWWCGMVSSGGGGGRSCSLNGMNAGSAGHPVWRNLGSLCPDTILISSPHPVLVFPFDSSMIPNWAWKNSPAVRIV